MRIVFVGTPEFALYSLEALCEVGHDILCVYAQGDKKKGRGQKLSACAVKTYALKQNLAVFTPKNISDLSVAKQLFRLKPDLIIVVAYGQILPKNLLNIPKFGCINIHASLLPRWRGAAPIERAILKGDNKTGVCTIKMDEGLDTGAILLKRLCPIDACDSGATLRHKLGVLSKEVIIETLAKLNTITPVKQSKLGVCYAHKLRKNEAAINWKEDANAIERKIRAFNPYPIATSYGESETFKKQTLRILEAELLSENNSKIKENTHAGLVIKQSKLGIDVMTGSGILRIKTLQIASKKALQAHDFINAYKIEKFS